MNAQRSENELDFGTLFEIDFHSLWKRESSYTVQQLITALNGTTTLTELSVNFENFEPMDGNNQRAIVDPLCCCIANLRLQNEHHPLRKLALNQYWEDELPNGQLGVFQQFLAAAKQYRICCLQLFEIRYVPMEVFVDFCRGNNDLKDLEMDDVNFTDEDTAVDRPQDASFLLTLDKLTLDNITLYDDDSSATVFADLVARLNFSVLELGVVQVWDSREGNSCDLMMNRIGSELFKSPLDHLTLLVGCDFQHLQAALEAGVVSVADLSVYLDNVDTFSKVELIATMIRGAVQLSSFAIEYTCHTGTLCQAIEACATVTRIQVNKFEHHFSPDQVQQLQKVTARNKELTWFRVNPSIYPARNLPALMCQFDNCPTGRYMLARRLPEFLSFDKLCNGRMTEPHQKRRKTK